MSEWQKFEVKVEWDPNLPGERVICSAMRQGVGVRAPHTLFSLPADIVGEFGLTLPTPVEETVRLEMWVTADELDQLGLAAEGITTITAAVSIAQAQFTEVEL